MSMTKGKSTNPAINYSCVVRQGTSHGPCPIPQEGSWTKSKEIKDISGLSHGVGGCAPRQGACKLTLNVKRGIIEEALIETLGCSGMTHSACMAGEIIKGKTLLEALNTDLVCDAINDAMKDIFFQLVYGRSQSAFSAGGLEIGAGIEELGSSLVSQFGTVYTGEQGVRYLQTTEGYITKVGLDKNDEVIGYEFVNLGRFMQKLKQGKTYDEAYEQSMGTYGRFSEAVKIIDPRD